MMIAHEVGMLKRAPSRKDALNAELATIKATQKSLMQKIHDRHAEGRPRLAILDDQLDELEVTREKLVLELATIQLKQWKISRTIFRELMARGAKADVALQVAGNSRRWWLFDHGLQGPSRHAGRQLADA
ncbi:hypothetical protein ACDY97_30830, partial [Rhizobium mongolense]